MKTLYALPLMCWMLVRSIEAATYTTDGCQTAQANHDPQESSTGAVRCCRDGGWCDTQFTISGTTLNFCYGDAVPFSSAVQACAHENARLCTRAELDAGNCCGTGCGYDAKATWYDNCAANPCVHGTCTGSIASYTCACDVNYFGQNCDEPQIFSRYDFDAGNLVDQGVAGNDLTATFTPDADAVCGGSLRLNDSQFYDFNDPQLVPIGAEPWTLAIYARCIEATDTRPRIFIHLGSDESPAYQGIGIGVDSAMGLVVYYYLGWQQIGYNVDFNWHQYVATYDGQTMRVYVDELEVWSKAVPMDLIQQSAYGTMSIGERHNGGSYWSRDGVWLFDEAVFARDVVDFDRLRAPCAIEPRTPFSRYPLDGDFVDTAPAGNSLTTTFAASNDSVCDGSLYVPKGTFYSFNNPQKVPLGNEPWTMAIYAKCVTAPTRRWRVFIHLGGDDLNAPFQGIGLGVTHQSNQLYYTAYDGDVVVPGVYVNYEWHQYVVTYDSQTMRIYVDEEEVYSREIDFALVQSSAYGTMSIGERHTGGTSYAREGDWLFDEAVFGTGVVAFETLRAPCAGPPSPAPPTDAPPQ